MDDNNKEKIVCKYHPEEENSLIENHHEGTVVCTLCGLVVIDQVICEEAEWRAISDNPEKSRVGGAENRFLSSEKNLSTSIAAGSTSKNGYTTSILSNVKRKHIDHGIVAGLTRLAEMAERMHVAEMILDYSQYVYTKMYRKCKYKGIVLLIDAKVAACMYIACYQTKCPRTINEMCAFTEADRHEIERAVQKICKVLKIKLEKIDCVDLLPRLCGQLALPRSIERKAIEMVDILLKHVSKYQQNPETIAAASIYMVTRISKRKEHRPSKNEIAECVGISVSFLSAAIHYINSTTKMYSIENRKC